MIYVLSLLGFGDCLITYSIIERAGYQGDSIRIIGTEVTKQVASLVRSPPPLESIIFSDVPAFYAVRKHGLARALNDALTLRRRIKAITKPGDTVFFEKPPGIRNRWMVAGLGLTVLEVPCDTTAYLDRARSLAPVVGECSVRTTALPHQRARTLLINPSARIASKQLPIAAVRRIIQVSMERSLGVTLIDVDGTYAELEGNVSTYVKSPSLSEAARALRDSDRYIGPDSFFLHLAHYYGVPSLAFFLDKNSYFRPPGLQESGYLLLLDDLSDHKLVNKKVTEFLEGSSINQI